jgi:hypothetical protein
MKTPGPSLLLISLFIQLFSAGLYSQRFDHADKIAFADSVRKIKVWTYISRDSLYRYHGQALESITAKLSSKGYIVVPVSFDPAGRMSAKAWKDSIISRLSSREAFLEMATEVKRDKKPRVSNRQVKTVISPSGEALATQNSQMDIDTSTAVVSSRVMSQLYLRRTVTLNELPVPAYSRVEELESKDIGQAAAYTLNGVPASKHPSLTPVSAGQVRVHAEFTAFGGYVAPSSMGVDEGSGTPKYGEASYAWNGHYGLEIGMGITRNIDVIGQYRREVSMVNVNTPVAATYGEITMALNYLLFGMNYNFRINDVFTQYLGITLGGVNTVPRDKYFRDVWYLVVGAQGGVKFYLSRYIGLRLQAELLYQVHAIDAPFLYSMNVFNIPVDAQTNMLQWGFSGGFIFRLGEY